MIKAIVKEVAVQVCLSTREAGGQMGFGMECGR